jgi:hypothetical protein
MKVSQIQNRIARSLRVLLVPTMVYCLSIINSPIGSSGSSHAAVLSNGTGAPSPYGGYLCADVQGANSSASTGVQIWGCYGGLNQQFSLIPGQSFSTNCGLFTGCFPLGQWLEIFAMGGSMCLDVTGSSTNAGTNVQIYGCNQTGAQAWNYTQFGQLINANSGLCLDAGNQTWGTRLVVNPCVGSTDPSGEINVTTNPPIPSQIWQFK